ncbi:MAG: site-specific integrase [Chloroflexota bacterium]|nr:site-specific integrase [Chloroflexota bacterium]
MHDASTVEVPGPLGLYAPGFRQELSRLGYSRWTAYALLLLMADVSRWMVRQVVEPAQLDTAGADAYLAYRRDSGQVRRRTRRGLLPLLGYLRSVGVFDGPAVPVAADPLDRLLGEFEAYLSTERGLAVGTIWGYRHIASLFCATLPAPMRTDGGPLSDLTAARVNAFMLDETGRRTAGTAGNVVTSLRAFLRFAYLQGHTPVSLADAVLTAPGWRDSGRSRAVPDAQVAALLASCDRRTPIGRRDFAILTVLARLGLRAKEVTALRVDDINWRAGEITVAGKGNRRERLPLPVDVGAAIAEYCRHGRRRGDCRAVFLHARAPYAALTSDAVTVVVKRACERAGLPPIGAHRLRHSTATALRRAGAPLLEIGQLLRHRHTVTTAIYAKDDIDALATIAKQWPAVGAS